VREGVIPIGACTRLRVEIARWGPRHHTHTPDLVDWHTTNSCDLHVHNGLSATFYSGWSQLCMRVAARQHWVAQCGRQDGGVPSALPALHAAFSSTATFFTTNLLLDSDSGIVSLHLTDYLGCRSLGSPLAFCFPSRPGRGRVGALKRILWSLVLSTCSNGSQQRIIVGEASNACLRSLACMSSLACRGRVFLLAFLLECYSFFTYIRLSAS
jgi:hypothetical protein